MRQRLPRSLLGQVLLLHMIVAALAAVVLPIGVGVMLHRTARHYEKLILEQKASAIARRLAPSVAANCSVMLVDASPAVIGLDGVSYAVVSADGRVLQQAGAGSAAIGRAAPRGRQARYSASGTMELLSRPLDSQGCAWLVVAQDTAAPQFVSDDIVRTFLAQFALLATPLILVVPGVGALLMMRMTRRLKSVSVTASAIGPRHPDVRLPLAGLPREIEPLAQATNDALDRLAAGLRAQGEFSANVAHELRTPLTTLRLRIEAMEASAIRAGLIDAVDRAIRVVTQLLALVDLERPTAGVETFSPHRVLEHVAADRAPTVLAGKRTIELAPTGQQVRWQGVPHLLERAIDNLVDNAIRHTPEGTSIVLGVEDDGRLFVEDDGPGIAPGVAHKLTTRHWRSDQSGSEGAGIGLSIVARIADALGAALDIGPRPDGPGVRFQLSPEPRTLVSDERSGPFFQE